jgi:thiamine-monophosphate kinase
VTLIGGDTSSSPAGLVISVTVIGEQSPDLIVRRSGARPGDFICVTGTLGDAALGLALLKEGVRDGAAIARHLDPLPRVREGIKLAESGIPSAMIDISDGLLADLGHILNHSGTGGRLYLEKLPISGEYREKQPISREEFFLFPLSGGEDYELLFTTPPDKVPALHSIFAETGTTATVIGEITPHAGLSVLTPSGIEYTPKHSGFNHFSRY